MGTLLLWEHVCRSSDQDFYASVAVLGCAKESVYFLVLPLWKLFTLDPGSGGNSAQLLSSPRLHTEQWTEPALICIHRSRPQFAGLGAPGAASQDSHCYCTVRLFQFNMNTNQTRFHAGLLRSVSPAVRTQKCVRGGSLLLSTLLQSASTSTHNWRNN